MTVDTKSFFENDFSASLFPLKTNQLMMRHHAADLEAHVARVVSSASQDRDFNFLAQTKTHAAKPRNHLRRTAVLDPVATYFVYDFVFRNQGSFTGVVKPERKAFGYQFEGSVPIPVHKAFQDFSNAVASAKLRYVHFLSFDIASYFNSLYHHDLAHWLLSVEGLPSSDADAMARFLREANSGRSIDCLPQGVYPTKMIGSAFLGFVEANGQLRCAQTYRFMDDIYLFDDDEQVLIKDFLLLQKLLGQFALNVNPTKTSYDGSTSSVESAFSEIQAQLDSIIDEEERPAVYFGSGVEVDWGDEENDEDDPDESSRGLTAEQTGRLFNLLLDPRAEEADVERILSVLLEDTDTLVEAVPVLFKRFPNIVKQLHRLFGLIEDKEALAEGLLEMLAAGDIHLLEYQLFWAAVIAEDHLSTTKHFGPIVIRLFELTGEYEIARAKVLEIPDQRFGLREIRDSILKSGASNWLAWSSAMGTRSLPKAARNHMLKYFAKGSAINQLIADCVSNLP
ncbi:hypothetical protein LH425_14775 [Laribacter hongkongensis]|uniref:antiviral reverse transcriptase Drt5 n=1 Tax=Laribacter hongkongensis TaxID=168471 RepID=UPI001EFE32BA|nr:antiviral reverse transcriptase Drt5 [Laribacter hongkongensis]MCG9066258.1 hypothetical protein [Laribacter hongkongensis]